MVTLSTGLLLALGPAQHPFSCETRVLPLFYPLVLLFHPCVASTRLFGEQEASGSVKWCTVSSTWDHTIPTQGHHTTTLVELPPNQGSGRTPVFSKQRVPVFSKQRGAGSGPAPTSFLVWRTRSHWCSFHLGGGHHTIHHLLPVFSPAPSHWWNCHPMGQWRDIRS